MQHVWIKRNMAIGNIYCMQGSNVILIRIGT
jgi:hypothetical protein